MYVRMKSIRKKYEKEIISDKNTFLYVKHVVRWFGHVFLDVVYLLHGRLEKRPVGGHVPTPLLRRIHSPFGHGARSRAGHLLQQGIRWRRQYGWRCRNSSGFWLSCCCPIIPFRTGTRPARVGAVPSRGGGLRQRRRPDTSAKAPITIGEPSLFGGGGGGSQRRAPCSHESPAAPFYELSLLIHFREKFPCLFCAKGRKRFYNQLLADSCPRFFGYGKTFCLCNHGSNGFTHTHIYIYVN